MTPSILILFVILGCYAGKHPVSALHELSTRKRWTVDYDLIECSGPSHNRNFKYQVNCHSYIHSYQTYIGHYTCVNTYCYYIYIRINNPKIKRQLRTRRISLIKGGILRSQKQLSGPVKQKNKEKTLVSPSKALTRFSSL